MKTFRVPSPGIGNLKTQDLVAERSGDLLLAHHDYFGTLYWEKCHNDVAKFEQRFIVSLVQKYGVEE